MDWTEDLATGVATIDNQHKELIARINQLFAACSSGKGKEEMGRTLDFLGEYVVFHFGAEEKEMKARNYPNYAAHKAQHDGFIRDFTDLKGKFEAEGPTVNLVIAANKILVDWLINHIRNVDKVMAGFLKQNA